MHTPNMKKHKLTLLLTLLPALTLTVFADNKVVTSGTVMESGSTYESTSSQSALQVSGSETLYEGANLTLSGTAWTGAGATALIVSDQGTVDITGGNLTTTGSLSGSEGNVYGIRLNASKVELRQITATMTTNLAGLGDHSTLIITDSELSTNGNGPVVRDSVVSLTNFNLNTRLSALTLQTGGTALLNSGTMTVTGTGNMWGVAMQEANTRLHANAVVINPSGARGLGVVVTGSGAYAEFTDSVINTPNITDRYGAVTVGQSSTFAAYHTSINSSLNGITVELGDSVVILENSSVTSSGSGSALDIMRSGKVTVNGGTLATNGGQLLSISNGAGDSKVTQVTLNDVDTSAAGGITSITGGTATVVNVNGGSGLNGDVTNSGSGTLAVNLNGSTLTGDVINDEDGVLVITLDHNSTGTGGYHGGDLITGSDSVWTFDKDSHGNYGENHGVWNIGDYEVIFDNMTHSGTINISVNSDTGEGGSLNITDTADGDGTVHIDTTGNGQLNPNDVLPGIVSGDGTEHWQWDPIDWGIDTIIKDGDYFIKQGTSPAGAVLNSSVAIQQAMWFAQQNSLLKRMGELRYGARASRPPAGETP
ncbi:MAG: hypothetical protein LBK71_11075, partial [Verrucomicrobiales bacterium]|nr:hypothetical protein [Verrucomicrobiales bacterium]